MLGPGGNRLSTKAGAVGDGRSVLTDGAFLNHALQSGCNLTEVAHALWAPYLRRGAVAVDATGGRGLDALFIARTIGADGCLTVYDIQEEAIRDTKARLESSLAEEERPRLMMRCKCHSRMLEDVAPRSVDLTCFNLGYLPRGDKSIRTREETSTAAVLAACQAVKPGGAVSVMCYVGHEGGPEEYHGVREAIQSLSPQEFTCLELTLTNRPTAPILTLVAFNGDGGRPKNGP